MAGRRRSLLNRARPAPSVGKTGAPSPESEPDEAEVASPPPSSEAPTEEPADAEQITDVQPLGPPPEPSDDLVTEGPVGPPPPLAPVEARKGPYAEVSDEGSYQDESSGPEHDTSPIGWGSSVHDGTDPIDDFFDTSSKGKTAPPGKTQPQKDPARPVSRDAGPAWQDPMGVPAPPPLPGLSDRFTPPPVERKSFGGTDDRPAYAPTPPPPVTPPPDPRAGRRKPETLGIEPPEEPAEVTDHGPTPFGLPRYLILPGIVTVGLILVIAVVIIAIRLTGGGDDTTIIVAPRPVPIQTTAEPEPGGLQVRSTLRDPNGTGDTATPTVEEPVAPGTAPAPKPGTAPVPVAAPAPAPRPAPVAAPVPVTRTGTIRIRSNRKVLVFVNGRAMGHAPLDLPLVPGAYTLSAALPSRPDTEQTKVVDLSAGETERIDFNY